MNPLLYQLSYGAVWGNLEDTDPMRFDKIGSNARGIRRAVMPLLALAAAIIVALGAGGCGHANPTLLELAGNPDGPARYGFREVLWCPHPDGVEFIGYGLRPFYNSPLSRNYDGSEEYSGYDVIWLHCFPASPGRYAVTMLYPTRRWGPSPDEVLRGTADAAAEPTDPDTQTLTLAAVPVRSRLDRTLRLTLSGSIVAQRGADALVRERAERLKARIARWRESPPAAE